MSVATDGGGPAAAEEWLRAARATHPALVDEWHEVPRLYGMVNVPNAVWIDEQGRIVRPAETAGSIDAFRGLDRTSLARTEEAAAAVAHAREQYLEAVRQWARTGRHALAPGEVSRRARVGDPLAATHFRLGEALHRRGEAEAARRHLARAIDLEPESWNYRREAIALADAVPGQATPLSAMGPSAAVFWEAVDALGERPFYPPARFDAPPDDPG